ncbi:MAG: hypothetical protein QE278_02180 [Limnobacter sp.]|nr:hypothetical protein [Limnobacter sp.]
MPVTLRENEDIVVLYGACTVEDAEVLHGYLTSKPGWLVDAGECDYMHTAVIQSLISCQPQWLAWPKPPHLNKALQKIFASLGASESNLPGKKL